jgi:hypothetical protein
MYLNKTILKGTGEELTSIVWAFNSVFVPGVQRFSVTAL